MVSMGYIYTLASYFYALDPICPSGVAYNNTTTVCLKSPPPPGNWTSNKNIEHSSQQQSAQQPAAFHATWSNSETTNQPTSIPKAFQTINLQFPINFGWFMDTCATNYHLAGTSNLQTISWFMNLQFPFFIL